MQRSTPLRNPHASTSDLLTWPELPPPDSAPAVSRSGHRSHQPSDRIGDVLRGGQLSEEEAQSLAKKKPCAGNQMKEMTGSRIFPSSAEDTASEASSANSKNRTGIRVYQQAINGISQISFSTEESISPKKPASLPEAAKQRELNGTLQSEPDTKSKMQISSAKTKELSGNDIFGPPQEIVPRSLAAPRTLESKESKDMGESDPRNVHRSVKVSNPAGVQSNILFDEEAVKKTSKKIHEQKLAELTGNNIFTGTEKLRSTAKLREMAGSDIFADGKAENRGNILGGRTREMAGSNIFADGKAENRGNILGGRTREMAGSNIFADGKAENRDNILGGRTREMAGSDIFADGKAENRDNILGSRRPPGGGSSISLV